MELRDVMAPGCPHSLRRMVALCQAGAVCVCVCEELSRARYTIEGASSTYRKAQAKESIVRVRGF